MVLSLPVADKDGAGFQHRGAKDFVEAIFAGRFGEQAEASLQRPRKPAKTGDLDLVGEGLPQQGTAEGDRCVATGQVEPPSTKGVEVHPVERRQFRADVMDGTSGG